MAGESAREVARRRREKADRLNRMATRYERGAEGEEATARALKALSSDWSVMHDVRWPGRRFANIDHVVIGPAGIFVIDSKMWAGTLTVINDVLRQDGRKRETAVAGVADSAIAVAELVPGLDPYLVKPVLCFVRDQELAGSVRDVVVCSSANLVSTLTSRATLLDATGRRNVHAWLKRSLQSATAPTSPANWPPPVARPPSPPRPPGPRLRTKQPRPVPRRHGRSILKSCMGTFLVVAVLFFAATYGINLLGDFAQRLGSPIQSAPGQTTPGQASQEQPAGQAALDSLTLGDAARFTRGTNRPPLRVVAEHVGTTRSTQGLTSYMPGYRLFGVTLRITNLGKHRWISQPGTVAAVGDTLGVPHRATRRYPVVRAGKVFSDVIGLKPGSSLRRVFVFEVPIDRPVTSFTLTVGPGQPETATWTVDRQ